MAMPPARRSLAPRPASSPPAAPRSPRFPNGTAHPTSFAYDAMSRLTGITYPDHSTVGFAYDTRGRRTSVTDQNGKTTNYTYDDGGLAHPWF